MGRKIARQLPPLIVAVLVIGLAISFSSRDKETRRIGSPCRSALADNLPPTVSVDNAVDLLLTHPHSAKAVQVRGAVQRAVDDLQCRDQRFLICTGNFGVAACTRALNEAADTRRRKTANSARGVDAGSGNSRSPSGQPGPAPSGGGAQGQVETHGTPPPGGTNGGGAANQKPPPVSVNTPPVPIVGQPQVCTPLAAVNC